MATSDTEKSAGGEKVSTQNTQYDAIGSKYGDIKSKPATQPEPPSVVEALGDVSGKRCLGRLAFFFSLPPLPPVC
ncbi:uncharacterized protein CC84DRAFT_1167367 [Paraphaeosphaeria sporulosa]|uniref:Uncharacterized protein n=1 Tax=Paraphaeosphaeria sporulosa TaxID=1460663 RepID=A0A177C684_9PLEO|nr:uncharacterized protein CC84DRAFT_1167367 [Paraphaeosphaeria sporulosa]OAG02288.1 hypothetical protein CC84DRAFT_1167367 [Paraphaeosphaeria sporulosa]